MGHTPEKVLTEPTYSVEVFVAGDYSEAVRICREFCMEGLCVTVEPTLYVYTGGAESGVRVGLTNYPRFPSQVSDLWGKAERLATSLRAGLFQTAVLIRDRDRTAWLTTRD